MIKTDRRVLHAIEQLSLRPDLPLKSMIDDALTIMRNAKSPEPRSSAILKARLMMANERSRLVEHRVSIMRELALVSRTATDLRNFVGTKYQSFLNSVKNQSSREAMIADALRPFSSRASKLQSALEVINTIIADLDSKAFSVRDVIEAMKLGERE